MKARIFLVMTAATFVVWMNPPAGTAGRCTDQNIPVRIDYDNSAGDKIQSDSKPYDGVVNICSGTLDVTASTLASKKRWFNFNFSGLLNGTGEVWMSGWQALPTFINVRQLGGVRETNCPNGCTAQMSYQFNAPDNKSYRLAFFSNGVDMDTFGSSLPDVNTPLVTSPVFATFTPGTGSQPNPYGQWTVDGRLTVGTQTEIQVGTAYKSDRNQLVKVGQFSMPFGLKVTALAPLP